MGSSRAILAKDELVDELVELVKDEVLPEYDYFIIRLREGVFRYLDTYLYMYSRS